MKTLRSCQNSWYRERNKQIAKAYNEGVSLEDIAWKWKIEVRTLIEILRGFGLVRVKEQQAIRLANAQLVTEKDSLNRQKDT